MVGRSLSGRPLAGRALGARSLTVMDGQNVVAGKASELNALSPSKQKLASQSGDVNWLWLGDSVGFDDNRMFRPLVEAIAAQYPAFTVVYYGSDAGSPGSYEAPETIQTGTGSRTLRAYNGSLSGTTSRQVQGSLFAGLVTTPGRTWDVVFVNYGKNQTNGAVQGMVEGAIMALIAQIQLVSTTSNWMVIDQYPNRDDAAIALLDTSLRDLVSVAPELSMIDLYTGPYVSGDYIDNKHATDTAYATKINPKLIAYWNATKPGAWNPPTPWMSVAATNKMRGNGNEQYWNFGLDGDGSLPGANAGAKPAGHNLFGTIAFTKETTIVLSGNARCQKMQGSGAAAAAISRAAVPAEVASGLGNRVTMVAWVYTEAGSDATVGRIGIQVDGTGAANVRSWPVSEGHGGWRLDCIGPVVVPANATFIASNLNPDTDATPDATHPFYVQKYGIFGGTLPRQL